MIRLTLGAALLASAGLCAASAQDGADTGRVTRGNLVMENIPDIPGEVRERLQQYQNVRSAGFSDFAPDGGIYITTRFGETSQIHHVAMPMGMRRQITFYDEPVGGANVRPDGSGQFAFSRDTGGDEYYQGYLYDPEDGSVTRFTEEGTRNGSFIWSEDGARMAWYRSTEGEPDWDILIADPSDPDSLAVAHEGTGAIFPGDFSPSGGQVRCSSGCSRESGCSGSTPSERGPRESIDWPGFSEVLTERRGAGLLSEPPPERGRVAIWRGGLAMPSQRGISRELDRPPVRDVVLPDRFQHQLGALVLRVQPGQFNHRLPRN